MLPFINILDFEGKPLRDEITSFRYQYVEEGDDVCEIVFEFSNVAYIDDPKFEEGKSLQVSWGWVDGPISETRKVYIWDSQSTFEEKVQMKLVCHEKGAVTRVDRVQTTNQENLPYGTPLMFSSETLKNLNARIQQGDLQLRPLLEQVQVEVSTTAGIVPRKFQGGNAILTYYNGNRSSFQGLRTYLNGMPGGPYVIESRDDYILVRTRDLDSSSKRTWTYRGEAGDLIEFVAETRVRAQSQAGNSGTNVVFTDEENKEVRVNQVDAFSTRTVSFGDDPNLRALLLNPLAALNNPTQYDYNYAPTYGKKPSTQGPADERGVLEKLFGVKGQPENTSPTPGVYGSLEVLEDGTQIWRGNPQEAGHYGTVARSSTAVVNNKIWNIPKGKTQFSAEEDQERALATAVNEQENAELQNNRGSATVIGEPSIKTGDIITIENVGSKDSGNYYVMECEHTISAGDSYMLALTLSRDGRKKNKGKKGRKKKAPIFTSDDYVPYALGKDPNAPQINDTVGPRVMADNKLKTVEVDTPDNK